MSVPMYIYIVYIDTTCACPYFSIFKVAYFGKAAETLDYFEAIGLSCAIHFNPADFLRK